MRKGNRGKFKVINGGKSPARKGFRAAYKNMNSPNRAMEDIPQDKGQEISDFFDCIGDELTAYACQWEQEISPAYWRFLSRKPIPGVKSFYIGDNGFLASKTFLQEVDRYAMKNGYLASGRAIENCDVDYSDEEDYVLQKRFDPTRKFIWRQREDKAIDNLISTEGSPLQSFYYAKMLAYGTSFASDVKKIKRWASKINDSIPRLKAKDGNIFCSFTDKLKSGDHPDYEDIATIIGDDNFELSLELQKRIALFVRQAPGYTHGKGQNEDLTSIVYALTKVSMAPYVVSLEGYLNG